MRKLLVGLILLSLGGPSLAQDLREYQLKAAFLHGFINLIEWPQGDGVLRLGVLGSDPFGESLEALKGKQIQGKSLEIVHLRDPDFTDLDVVFVSVSQTSDLPLIIHSLEGLQVLSVSDIPDFGKAGGVITMVNRDNRVRFQLNQEALKKTGLKAKPELIRLAEKEAP